MSPGSVNPQILNVGTVSVWLHGSRDQAAENLRAIHAHLANALDAFLREHLLAGVGPPPVGEVQLEEIRKRQERLAKDDADDDPSDSIVLLALVDHLSRQAAFLMREEGHLDAYQRGYADGIVEGKRRCVETMMPWDDWGEYRDSDRHPARIVGAVDVSP
jgi:hypothetical protein